MLRRLFPSPRWVLLFALSVLLAVLFVRLGIWQLHRLDERHAFNAAIARAEKEPPKPLGTVMPNEAPSEAAAYRRVEAAGTYLPQAEVVLYGRSLRSVRGNHVLTPLQLEDGRVLVVDRGWVPFRFDTPPVPSAEPPGHPVTVMGVLFPFERDSEGTEPATTITYVDRGRIEATVGRAVVPLYLWLQSQEPPADSGLPRVAPLPDPTEGPHLSYAIQWFLFAAVALVGFAVLATRTGSGRHRSI